MRLPESQGIWQVDTTAEPDMLRGQKRNVVCRIEAGQPLSIGEADLFLETDFHESSRPELLDKIMPASLLAGSAVVQTAIDYEGEKFPTLGVLPHLAKTTLDTLASLTPLNYDQTALDPASVGAHLPNVMLGAGILAGTIGVFQTLHDRRDRENLTQRAQAAQAQLAEAVATGRQAYEMPPGSVIAFSGYGASAAKELARMGNGAFVQIAYEPVQGPYVVLPQDASRRATREALQQAGLAQAGHVVFFPTHPSEEFLPGREYDAHDQGVDRIDTTIGVIDEVCHEQGWPYIPVTVVGNADQTIAYHTAGFSSDAQTEVIRLEDRLSIINEQRRPEVNLIDIGAVITGSVVALADKRPVLFSSTEDGYEERQEAFFAALRGHQRNVDGNAPGIRVIYNKNDRSTETQTGPDDIAVVHNPSEIGAFTQRGISAERVLVVPTEILKQLQPLLPVEFLA